MTTKYICLKCGKTGDMDWHDGHLEANPDHDSWDVEFGSEDD